MTEIEEEAERKRRRDSLTKFIAREIAKDIFKEKQAEADYARLKKREDRFLARFGLRVNSIGETDGKA